MAALAAVSASGCLESGHYESRSTELGRVCLYADPTQLGGAQVFAADQPVTVEFGNECLSECIEQLGFDLTVDPTSDGFVVAGRISWQEFVSPSHGCIQSCNAVMTRHDTNQLAAGSYTFRYRDKAIELTIPSTHPEPPCVASE